MDLPFQNVFQQKHTFVLRPDSDGNARNGSGTEAVTLDAKREVLRPGKRAGPNNTATDTVAMAQGIFVLSCPCDPSPLLWEQEMEVDSGGRLGRRCHGIHGQRS
ncbi:MAG: hypothetical protein ACPGVU_02095 [Limisphaerales bacterium]